MNEIDAWNVPIDPSYWSYYLHVITAGETLQQQQTGQPEAFVGLGLCQPPSESMITSAAFGPQEPRL